jgi:hypothetical protein
MESTQDYSTLLILLGGLSGIALYAEAARVGLRDKGYAIPVWVIGLNFSWAVIHTLLVGKIEGASLPVLIVAVRIALDIVVLYTWFKFGGRHFPENPGEGWFVPWSLLVIVVAFILHSAVIMQFGISPGLAYTAVMQNFVMSLLVIAMLARRKRQKAQSMIIAVAKLSGSLALTILYGVLGAEALDGPNNLLLVIGSLSCLFDLIYIALLSQAKPYEKREKELATIVQQNMTGGEFDAFRS